MNPFQICKEQFRATWSEDLMGASAWNVNAPRDINGSDYIGRY